ncbi:leucine-rich repeat-containing protein [Tanacetum coccineum]
MRENAYFYFMHTFILSLVLLWFITTTATSFGHQLVAAAEGNANYKCIVKERQALLDFKSQLQDPNDMFSTWRPDEEDDCCQWRGVGCSNQTGHVTSLHLPSNLNGGGLVGEISFSLLNLSYLNDLDLSYNSFHGNIPPFIGSMAHLTNLDLGQNQFSGTLPESIGNMTQLTYLSLGENYFSGVIPQSIGSLTNLTYLNLYGNQLTGSIPTSIGSLTELKILNLSYNSFYGTIPRKFGNLTNLDALDLDSVGSCTIENLDWLSSLSYLTILIMDGISLANANNWVNVIIGLQNLSVLGLYGCDLSQVMHPYSSSVNSSSSIDVLFLDNNNLNSSMFRWLGSLNSPMLSLSYNKLDGKLSDFLNNLSACVSSVTTLSYLDASSNQLTGSLSDEIQYFSFLFHLNLYSNELDGTISNKLWQLPNLLLLDLSSNSLRGAISENIGKTNLLFIDLSNNSLEGAPSNDDMSNLSQSIQYIYFSSNKLGPCFPKWIQKLKNLTHLDLSRNNISDTISTNNWNQWRSSQLNYLDLSGNNFHGGISSLCQMYKNLKFLDLSRNMITGQLPDCFRNLTYLRVLNLGHNTLFGRIPPSIGYLGQLETLSLYNNNFFGALPVSLNNCTQLSFLDLGDNSFYGDIPVWIGKSLLRLYALSFKSNNFFGTIPSQICQLGRLQILDLSDNKLYGTIPSCVNSLTSMVQKGLLLEHNVHHYINDVILGSEERWVENSYIDHLMIKWQGKVNEFSSNLGLLMVIDLSSNNLTGQIPNGVTDLHGLLVLDLSDNSLDGKIPRDIGQMTQLLTLNLSRNMLSGEIPPTMSEMTLLNNLDMSFNDLSGKIPLGTQLQTFDASTYIGNAGLCGSPLPKKCTGDEDLGVPPVGESDGDGESTNELQRWFYIGEASGFATGFWIVCSALLLNRRGRHAFFQFHDCLKDWVYVNTLVFVAKFQRFARA